LFFVPTRRHGSFRKKELKKAEPFLPLPFFLNVTKSSKGNLEGAKVLEFKWK